VDLCAREASDVFRPPGAPLTLAMAIHELTTNALRHRALSAPGRRIRMATLTSHGDDGSTSKVVVEWVERGGPPVAGPPARTLPSSPRPLPR